MDNWLWIHGWGMSPAVWGDLSSRFPGRHHFADFSNCRGERDFCEHVRQSLTLGEAWTVAGWSMGGMAVLDALTDSSELTDRVGRVILIGSTLRFAARDRMQGWPERIVARMQRQLTSDPEATLQQFRAAMFHDTERDRLKPDDFVAKAETDFLPEGLQAGLDYLIHCNLSERWNVWRNEPTATNRRHPALLWIHGESDAICPVGAMPADLAAAEKAVLPRTGHIPFMTNKETVAAIIDRFLRNAWDGVL